MTPPVPGPEPLPLPAPGWLLWLLLTVTFVLHVLPMNLVLGGAIIGLVARLRARRQPHAAVLASLVARALPILVATAVSMGVAALLFLQAIYGRLFFTAAILLAAPWLSVVGLLVVSYYATYAAARSTGRAAMTIAAAGFVTIAFIYANAMGLSVRPEAFLARFQASASGLHLDLDDPTLVPRFLHVLFASLAVAGLGVSIAGSVTARRAARTPSGEAGASPDAWSWIVRHGVYWCAIATTLNFLPGFWWLGTLPREVLLKFIGLDPLAAACFAGALVASLTALGLAVPAAFAPRPQRLLTGAAVALALGVVLMVLVRDAARRAVLSGQGVTPVEWVAPQWGAIATFGVCLAAAAGAVWWMVWKLLRAAEKAPAKV